LTDRWPAGNRRRWKRSRIEAWRTAARNAGAPDGSVGERSSAGGTVDGAGEGEEFDVWQPWSPG
jgi:hypothetical protein